MTVTVGLTLGRLISFIKRLKRVISISIQIYRDHYKFSFAKTLKSATSSKVFRGLRVMVIKETRQSRQNQTNENLSKNTYAIAVQKRLQKSII